MRIITPDNFRAMPWKNGGGVTHEIAKEEVLGALIWRLSVAEVTSDGPFSAFPGLMRILTVISGAGLTLRTDDGVMVAEPFAPLRFPGDLPVASERIAGDVRDLNVIFDPRRVEARVTRRIGPFEESLDATEAFLCVWGMADADGTRVSPGSLVHGACALTLSPGATGLLIRIARI